MELTLNERRSAINKVTWWGVVVNIVLAIIKVIGGIIGHSAALLADGIHSLSDLASDGMVLFAAKHAGEDADEDHPYGHGKFETLATVGLGILLIAVGLGIAYDSVQRLLTETTHTIPHHLTLWVAGVSIVSKEMLYHYTYRVGTRIRSDMLCANAWHHRSDAISSIVVFIGIVGAMYGMPKLDAYAAIIVGLMVMKIGSDLTYQGLQELVDTSLEPELVEKIREEILTNEEVQHLHMLRTRRMGHAALVDVHIQVAPRLSVSEGHHIAETIEVRLIDRFDEINDVTVHIDPEDDEFEASSMNLPMRKEVLKALRTAWSEDELISGIQDVTLHYLSGKVCVEATLPLDGVESLESVAMIRERFRTLSHKIDYIGDVQLQFI